MSESLKEKEFAPDFCFDMMKMQGDISDYSDELLFPAGGLPEQGSSSTAGIYFFLPNKIQLPTGATLDSVTATVELNRKNAISNFMSHSMNIVSNWDGHIPKTFSVMDPKWDSGKEPTIGSNINGTVLTELAQGWQTCEISFEGVTAEQMSGGVRLTLGGMNVEVKHVRLKLKYTGGVEEPEPPPKITSTALIYSDRQVSSENRVPTGQGFIIQVGL